MSEKKDILGITTNLSEVMRATEPLKAKMIKDPIKMFEENEIQKNIDSKAEKLAIIIASSSRNKVYDTPEKADKLLQECRNYVCSKYQE